MIIFTKVTLVTASSLSRFVHKYFAKALKREEKIKVVAKKLCLLRMAGGRV
jgi:hypothetical protein